MMTQKLNFLPQIKKLISVNGPQISGSETLQKFFYSENVAKTHFRMIPEPYLV
jgi:hypothetical protein